MGDPRILFPTERNLESSRPVPSFYRHENLGLERLNDLLNATKILNDKTIKQKVEPSSSDSKSSAFHCTLPPSKSPGKASRKKWHLTLPLNIKISKGKWKTISDLQETQHTKASKREMTGQDREALNIPNTTFLLAVKSLDSLIESQQIIQDTF